MNSKKFGESAAPAARRIAQGFARLALVLRSQAWKSAAGEGVTPNQGEVLQHLSEVPNGLKLAELASKLGVSAPTASDAVSALVSKGLLTKAVGENKRSIRIALSPAGIDAAARAGDWPVFLAEIVATLDETEQTSLLTSLTKIIRQLQDQGHIAPQRMCVTCSHFRPFAHADAAQPHHCAFVDAAFGAADLRLNCPDHEPATADHSATTWQSFNR